MGKVEQKVNGILQNYPFAKKFIKRGYQRFMYAISSKEKFEGVIERLTPYDQFEYFFGYYDKSPWDITGQYILCNRVSNTYKNADCTDEAQLIIIDTENNNKVSILGSSHSWNNQQGCMLQWLGPDYSKRVIFNDFRNGEFCAVILNVKDKTEKQLPMPVYSVAADGTFALTLDFTRLHRIRPGYGYCNKPESTAGELCPEKTCIWRENLITGECKSVLKYTDFLKFENRKEMNGAEHKINHLMISPNGERFMVLHRWFVGNKKYTRLLTCDVDGNNMFNLLDDDFVSHCYWKNDFEIIAFAEKKGDGRGYFLLKDKTHKYTHLWKNLIDDGHPSYGPNGLVVTDTYPNRKRISNVYILDEKKNDTLIVSKVFSPFRYDNDFRCDLHPRWSRDGKWICIDSVYEGKRALYRIPFNQENASRIKVMVCLRRCINKGPVHQTYNILQNIDKEKIESVFFTMKKEDKADSVYDKFEELDIEKCHVSGNFKELLKGILLGKGQIIEKIVAQHPDIIHTTGIVVDLIGYKAAKLLGVQQVSTIRNYVYDDYIKKFGHVRGYTIAKIHLLMMKTWNKKCTFVCCSKSLSDKYYQSNGIKMMYIRNGVDVKRFNPDFVMSKKDCRKKLNLPEDAFIFITVAQIISRKNISETIDALPDNVNGKITYFVLVGNGTELENLKRKYNERKNLIYAGKQSNIEEWLKASDVFVSSSKSEGLPNAVIEAMAMELPIILSDIDQHKEIFELNPDIGYLYPLYNVNEFNKKLKQIDDVWINNAGKNGRALATSELSDKRMSTAYQDLYRRLKCLKD